MSLAFYLFILLFIEGGSEREREREKERELEGVKKSVSLRGFIIM